MEPAGDLQRCARDHRAAIDPHPTAPLSLDLHEGGLLDQAVPQLADLRAVFLGGTRRWIVSDRDRAPDGQLHAVGAPHRQREHRVELTQPQQLVVAHHPWVADEGDEGQAEIFLGALDLRILVGGPGSLGEDARVGAGARDRRREQGQEDVRHVDLKPTPDLGGAG